MISDAHRQAERTHDRHLPRLAGWAGWFALTRGDQLCGLYPDYGSAARAWLAAYGASPALIRRVAPRPGAAEAADRGPTATLATHASAVRVACGWALHGRWTDRPAYAA